MRMIATATALTLLVSPVLAQTSTQPVQSAPLTAAPATGTPAPAAAAPAPATPAPATSSAASSAKKFHKHTQSLQERFDAANTTHDGRLTKDQAAAAKWGYVTSHFSAIDKDHRGYVSVDDIRAYAKARHSTHKAPTNKPVAAPATNS